MESERPSVDDVFDSAEGAERMDLEAGVTNQATPAGDPCGSCNSNPTVYLFKMVYQSARKPDETQAKRQNILTWMLSGILIAQVVWAMILIPFMIFGQSIIAPNSLPFLTLLVTAILGEVVAMAFVVVKFVFKSPLSEMLDILKELIKRK